MIRERVLGHCCQVLLLLGGASRELSAQPNEWRALVAENRPTTAADFGLLRVQACKDIKGLPDTLVLQADSTGRGNVHMWSPAERRWFNLPVVRHRDTLSVRVLKLECRTTFPDFIYAEHEGRFWRANVAQNPTYTRGGEMGENVRGTTLVMRDSSGALSRPVVWSDQNVLTIMPERAAKDSALKWKALSDQAYDGERAAERRRERLEAERVRKAWEAANATKRRALLAKGWPPDVVDRVVARKVSIGMTREQVVAAWGEPQRRTRTILLNRIEETWVFADGDQYVFLVDGVVRAIKTYDE